jgi:membrane protein YdbS with pleckstrin-like domain
MKQANGATKPTWLAWAVTLAEVVLLGGFAVALSRYWLMLPIWMRSTVGSCLAVAAAIVFFRMFRFYRRRKRAVNFPKEEAPPQTVS